MPLPLFPPCPKHAIALFTLTEQKKLFSLPLSWLVRTEQCVHEIESLFVFRFRIEMHTVSVEQTNEPEVDGDRTVRDQE